jgi:hypothetical protein
MNIDLALTFIARCAMFVISGSLLAAGSPSDEESVVDLRR